MSQEQKQQAVQNPVSVLRAHLSNYFYDLDKDGRSGYLQRASAEIGAAFQCIEETISALQSRIAELESNDSKVAAKAAKKG